MLLIFSGYDPRYLPRAVAAGRENYYLSAVAEHGEPPGIWAGLGCPELGLPIGSEVDGPVLERLYEQVMDPGDPAQLARLGRAPSAFGGPEREDRRADHRPARRRTRSDEGTPRSAHHAGAERPPRDGLLLRRHVLRAQVGKPLARIVPGQGAASAGRGSGRRSRDVDCPRPGGVGRDHGREPGDAGLPAARGRVQPGWLSLQALRAVRRRARVRDRPRSPSTRAGTATRSCTCTTRS